MTEMGHLGLELKRAAAGTQRTNKLTYQQIVEADGWPVPPMLQKTDTSNLPKAPIGYDRYYDPKYVPLEREHIWLKCWQVACREEDLPNVGDRLSYDVADLSFLIVRSGPTEFKAFYNTCRHRGRRLCDHADRTSGQEFRCPFHAWTWNLDGSLAWIPSNEDFPHVDRLKYALDAVQVDTWGGNVFINPDPDAKPLAKALGAMPRLFEDHPMEDRYTVLHVRKKMRANWKVAQEAFMEAYHVIETHPDILPFVGSAFSQYDVWDDGDAHLNWLITPAAMPDLWVEGSVNSRQALEQACAVFDVPRPPEGRGLTVTDARAYIAEERRKQYKAANGHDASNMPPAQFLDMVKAFVFPNHHPWWGEMIPWWYRFLPIGNDPEACVMEVRVTARKPKDGPCPPSATPIDVDFDENAADYEAEVGILGFIVDQDISNMVSLQKGMATARAGSDFATLARYQECNIQHFNHAWARQLKLID